jgi:hypothetical protein
MGTHPSKVQSKWEYKVNTTQRKNNQQKSSKDLMQRGFMATKWQSTIWKIWQLPNTRIHSIIALYVEVVDNLGLEVRMRRLMKHGFRLYG